MSGKPLTRDEVDLFLRMRPHSRRAFMAAFGASAAAFSVSPDAHALAMEPMAHQRGREIRIRGSEGPNLGFFNWDTYIGETTLSDFRAASGIRVEMSLFANNDELFARVRNMSQRGAGDGFDVIMPSNEFIPRLIEADLLAPLDHAKIPNKANLMPEFQDASFDPGRRYSMPYTWLVLGIGYRKSAMRGIVPDSWKFVFESKAFRKRISLLSESIDLFRLGFKYLGLPMNEADPTAIAQVEAMLIKQINHIKSFHNDDGEYLLTSKEVDLVIEYNGDIAVKITEDPDLAFVVPKEGSLLTQDCLCLLKNAPNPNNAHAFINFLLDAKHSANISKTILYPTPNRAAKALMGAKYRNSPAIFPPASAMASCEYARYPGSETLDAIEGAMTRVRLAQTRARLDRR